MVRKRAQKGQARLDDGSRPAQGPTLADLAAHLERSGLPLRHSYLQPPVEGSIGPFLREARVTRGMTQTELAEAAGLNQTQISAYERGVILLPNVQALARLDDALGLPRGTLLGRAGWQGAARRVERQTPVGALVVPQPTADLVTLVETAQELPSEQVAHLAQTARLMHQHLVAAREEPRDAEEPASPVAFAG